VPRLNLGGRAPALAIGQFVSEAIIDVLKRAYPTDAGVLTIRSRRLEGVGVCIEVIDIGLDCLRDLSRRRTGGGLQLHE
jgi:hypothetical protein